MPLSSIPFAFALTLGAAHHHPTTGQEEHRRSRSLVDVQVQRFEICSFVFFFNMLILAHKVVLLLGC